MKAIPIKPTLLLASIALLFSLAACAPKNVIKGRVVNAETDQPIKGAAVAIRWFKNQSDNSETRQTFDAAQDLSDKKGNFVMPRHPGKNYVMGVYKEGYICWSSRNTFPDAGKEKAIDRTRVYPRVKDGMEVRLAPLKKGDSQDQHAGFAVLVAEDVTASKESPFYRAIKPLFIRWRDNLRKQFRKTFGKQESPQPN
jgi:hypothetical protein